MSFIWAIVTGIVFSYFFKNSLMFFVGLFVGPMLYRFFNNMAPVRDNPANPTLYLTVAFEVLGHLSKAKGQVTVDDIRLASHYMDQLQLDAEKRKLAQDSFNRGKVTNYPLRKRLNEIYNQYRYRRKVLMVFCEQLIQAAMSDGYLDEKEKQILNIVAEEFHIPKAQMAIYIQMIMASYQFQRQQYSNQNYQSQHKGNYQRHYQQSTSKNDINNAYRVLGVDPSVDVVIIKRAYRKLMNEHHPDKLVSKGLPKEMLEAAKKRSQEIQAAYDLIKADRGFK
ncbi:co-chaperone DjlA [Frischella sp. Ac13]|uniref:Co-chaperone DjlA n=1 Tax=Frischella japonica TaxID=2741544 RepID=A0ABR7QUF8_9GAMM|nr:co-chaperone DjlA [Frischella japonica]MBC9129837.1 co-chaperone DjlA [Frischella japonica]